MAKKFLFDSKPQQISSNGVQSFEQPRADGRKRLVDLLPWVIAARFFLLVALFSGETFFFTSLLGVSP